MTAPLSPAPPNLLEAADQGTEGNRFLLSTVAFLRSKQLDGGAPARVAHARKKTTYIAVLEVVANTVSWSRV